VLELTGRGHRVLVEQGAGEGSGVPDSAYVAQGAEIESARNVWAKAELVVKVKEPQAEELPHLGAGQLLFTFFHFAASEALTQGVLKSGATAIAYETVEDRAGQLPLLTPMSEVAGRMSIQAGARHLERPNGGRGTLLGGVAGVAPGHVTILGAGVVGAEAARMAAGLGARVFLLDVNLERLRALADVLPANVITLYSTRHAILEQLAHADLVVGAVLVRGARAPRLVERGDLQRMKSGAVLVDVAVDQGGCFETSMPTTHDDPTYVVDGVVHYCVANMPGAVSRTSTFALCNATLPYVRLLAERGLDGALAREPGLLPGISIHGGQVTHPAVAAAFGLPYEPFSPTA
jgi:alanine dehydrogenase